MARIRGELARAAWAALIICTAAPVPSDAQTVNNCGVAGRTATFNFGGGFSHDFGSGAKYFSYPSVSSDVRRVFRDEFCATVAQVESWLAGHGWPPFAPRFRVFVSNNYDTSQSLIPAALNRRGRMEFPAFHVATGEAPLVHELMHVYQPNGNRMLAEGLAVYAQHELGKPAYPNYGADLDDMVRRVGCFHSLESVDLFSIVRFDMVATPAPLRLRVRRDIIGEDGGTYYLAGSFVKFLIETQGMLKFRDLYVLTPLVPMQRNGGSAERWSEIYGVSLETLKSQWKTRIGTLNC